MNSLQLLQLVALGLTAGVMAGMFGIGGGAIMVPAMMFFIGFPLRQAIGTSLAALLVPFGILGVLEYYKRSEVNITAAAILAIGLFAGSFFGAKLNLSLPDIYIKRAFGILLLVMGLRFITLK